MINEFRMNFDSIVLGNNINYLLLFYYKYIIDYIHYLNI